MSEEITFLLGLYREGKIDASALNNALNALKASPNPAMQVMQDAQDAQPPPTGHLMNPLNQTP